MANFSQGADSTLHSLERHTYEEMSLEQLREAGFIHWGVVREIQVKLRAVKG